MVEDHVELYSDEPVAVSNCSNWLGFGFAMATAGAGGDLADAHADAFDACLPGDVGAGNGANGTASQSYDYVGSRTGETEGSVQIDVTVDAATVSASGGASCVGSGEYISSEGTIHAETGLSLATEESYVLSLHLQITQFLGLTIPIVFYGGHIVEHNHKHQYLSQTATTTHWSRKSDCAAEAHAKANGGPIINGQANATVSVRVTGTVELRER